VGQAIGLPGAMTAFCFCGLAVTSATTVIFGRPVSDPVALLGLLPGEAPRVLGALGLLAATLSTNVAANLVAPATAIMALRPGVPFARAALAAGLAGAALQPWRVLAAGAQGFVLRWLVGYAALLGPAAGVVLADYLLVRRRELDVGALYSDRPGAAYHYRGGFNPVALGALALGALPSAPGFLAAVGAVPRAAVPAPLLHLYSAAWVVGFGVAAAAYVAGMRGRAAGGAAPA